MRVAINFALFFVILLSVGCSDTNPGTKVAGQSDIAEQIKSVPHYDAIRDTLSATNDIDRYSSIWPYVKSRSKTTVTIPVSPQGETAIHCQLSLADSAFDWSTGTVTREIAEDTYLPTAIATLGGELFGLAWKPTSHFATSPPAQSGSNDLLEWETEDQSTESTQRYVVRFRMPPKQ